MTEENENAMDDSVFTGFLQQIGLAPPSNEQVGFVFSFVCFLYIYIYIKISFIALFSYDEAHYFSFQPVLHDLCTKGHGMCYLVCWNLCTNWKEYPIKW